MPHPLSEYSHYHHRIQLLSNLQHLLPPFCTDLVFSEDPDKEHEHLFQIGNQRIEVDIPAGADNVTRIRVAGKGAPGVSGGPSGDLFLVIEVNPDKRFKRNGNNLQTNETIN